MKNLSGQHLCAMANIDGSYIAAFPKLEEQIDTFERESGHRVLDDAGFLKPLFREMAIAGVQYDATNDRASFQVGPARDRAIAFNSSAKPAKIEVPVDEIHDTGWKLKR